MRRDNDYMSVYFVSDTRSAVFASGAFHGRVPPSERLLFSVFITTE
jgi:hypothetical protein